jgi:hypothetical protein
MSIEYTKMDDAKPADVYDTLKTFWDQRWDRDFQQGFLDWGYAGGSRGEARCAVALPVDRAHTHSLLSRQRTAGVGP